MRWAFLLTLICSSYAGAQSGYQDGFVLTASLDTLRGFIRFPARMSVPMPCLLKTDKAGKPREVVPGTVHGFCTGNGAYYFSRTLGSTTDVFLEVLAKGYMNLFKFGNIYYVEKGDSVFFELSDDWEVAMADGHRQPQKSRNYTRMLSLLMADCPDVAKNASSIPLRDKPLVRLIHSYNQCKGSTTHLFRVKLRQR